MTHRHVLGRPGHLALRLQGIWASDGPWDAPWGQAMSHKDWTSQTHTLSWDSPQPWSLLSFSE